MPCSRPSGPEIDALVVSFFASDLGADYEACCHTSAWAAGMCCEVSEAFADHLHRSGYTDAVTLDLLATAEHPYVYPGSSHTVVRVGATVVDLTHRQFDPDAAVPHVTAAEDFLTCWRVVGRD